MNLPEDVPHSVAFADFYGVLTDDTITGRGDVHCCFLGLHFNDVLTFCDRISFGNKQVNDSGLSDGFSELGHDDRRCRHVMKFSFKRFDFASSSIIDEPSPQYFVPLAGEQTKGQGGKVWGCLWH